VALERKRKEQGERMEFWERKTLEGLIFFMVQNLLNLGELRLCSRILEGLGEFFKFNKCCYNILKLKI